MKILNKNNDINMKEILYFKKVIKPTSEELKKTFKLSKNKIKKKFF